MNKPVVLSSLHVNEKFRFIDYRDIPKGPIYRVVGTEFDCVTYVNTSDLFSPIFYAINYAFVIPIN